MNDTETSLPLGPPGAGAPLSLRGIGRRFGGRDHTTVLHGVRKIEELMPQDDQIARDVEALTRKLRG